IEFSSDPRLQTPTPKPPHESPDMAQARNRNRSTCHTNHLDPSRPISTHVDLSRASFFGIVLLLSIQFCVLHSELSIQRAPDRSRRQRYSLPITPDSSRQPAVRSEAGGSYRDSSGAIRTEYTFFLFSGKSAQGASVLSA